MKFKIGDKVRVSSTNEVGTVIDAAEFVNLYRVDFGTHRLWYGAADIVKEVSVTKKERKNETQKN